MIKLLMLFCMILIFYSIEIAADDSWNYKNFDQWPQQCHSGKLQSPIGLSSDTAKGVNYPPFIFNGYDELYPANITNNGHTIKIRFDLPRKPYISGGGLTSEFVLDAMHFHWDSEHTIDDKRFPLELHLVHYDLKSRDLKSALALNRKVAVLAVLFYHSPDDDAEFSQLFSAIQHLQQSKARNPSLILPRLELDDFLPRDRAGYYRYIGSLTTPPCTEEIIWTVFTNGIPISSRQLKVFSRLLSSDYIPIESNYRPLQDLNGRDVFLKVSDVDSAGHVVSVANSMKIMLLFVSLFLLW